MVIYTPVISGSLIISGSIVTTSGGLPLTGSLVSSGSFTSIGPTIISGSLTVITGSSVEFQVLDTGVRIGNLASDNHTVTGSLLVSGSITTTGNITATTLVVQTITSSVSNITGSTRFGSLAANTHQFTGSVLVSGSLGIGTSPSSPLDVVADNSTAINLRLRGRVLDNVGQMEFWNNAQSTRYGYIATDSVSMGIVTTQNLPLVLGTNSTERMRISGSNVGIGTTNPISQFHINGSTGGTFTDGLRINRNGNANQYTVINHVGGASNFMTVDTSGNNIAEMYFQRSINGTAATSSMMINTNGNVGIGMTNPTTARLQIQTSGNGLSYSSPFYSCDNSTYQNGFLISHLDGLTRLMTTYTGTGINCDMTFWTTLSNGNQGERMRITSDGGVLIGRTTQAFSPSTQGYMLSVGSSVSQAVISLAASGQTLGSGGVLYGLDNNRSFILVRENLPLGFDTNNTERMRITSGGYLKLKTVSAVLTTTTHRLDDWQLAQGSTVLVSGNASAADSIIIYSVDSAGANAAATALAVGRHSSTSRSINAGGSINASGADYAEYMVKAITDNIAKGDIVGINSEGKLTNIFNDAISFAVKSTDPAYVGNDTWGNVGSLDKPISLYTEEELQQYKATNEAIRTTVDRIAFSGQVPCNVTGANVGDYIIPIQLENGKIGGQAITNPTFEQYQISVGKVWKIMDDGRAWIAVKIG
jgi:hypothetical protein